jgi:hypothetical protein
MSWSLFSWNVLADIHINDDWYPGVPADELRGPARLARVLEHLGRVDADLIALQEISPALVAALPALFPDHGLCLAPYAGEGLALLVRGARPWPQVVPLPGGRKVALLVAVPGGPRVAVVHASYTGKPGAPGVSAERKAIPQLDAVLAYKPDVLVGDLNAEPGWPERLHLEAAGMVDRSPPGPTCNTLSRAETLDVLFTGPGWTARCAPPPALTPAWRLPDAQNPSDHLPLRGTVSRA